MGGFRRRKESFDLVRLGNAAADGSGLPSSTCYFTDDALGRLFACTSFLRRLSAEYVHLPLIC
jgi:hypothetical protein